jgi:four helix bundle protein
MTYRFEKLDAWKQAMKSCLMLYQVTSKFPPEEVYGLTSQLRRAASSIPLNIAEGTACKTKKEFEQFLYVALRSQYEVVTILMLARRLRYIDAETMEKLDTELSRTGRLVQGLINSLARDGSVQQPKTNNRQPLSRE